MNYKTCTKCGEKFPATNEFFHKCKAGRFGLHVHCKMCCYKYWRKYYKNNKEKYEKYRKNNKEKMAVYSAEWRKNNRERCLAVKKKYRENNKEKLAIYNAKWHKDNPDKHNAKAARRRARKLDQTVILTQKEKCQIDLIYKKRDELGPNWQVDHIWPISKGGSHHPKNLQIVTKKYNLEKGSKLFFRLPNNDEIFKF